MKAKRKFITLLTALSLFFTFAAATAVCAAEAEAIKHCTGLSCGLDIIKNDRKLIKTTDGEAISFSVSDFSQFAADSSGITGITVNSVPASGTGVLKFGALDAYRGQRLPIGLIRLLRFIPEKGSDEAEFSFSVTGTDSSIKCVLYTVEPGNAAPEASSFRLYTKKDIPVFSSLKCSDADGDSITYSVMSQPSSGLLRLSSDGSFVYTPSAGFTGRDSFTYSACDKYGNESETATVSIRTEKRTSAVHYSDMNGNKAQYAASLLADRGILVGRSVGGIMSFEPKSNVSRIDFLVMAMKAAGYSPNIYTATNTGLADEAALSEIQKGYVITALALGLIRGEEYGSALVLRPNASITPYEARNIMRSIYGSADGNMLPASVADDTVTAEALTRADCAVMLADYIDSLRD